MRAFLVFAATGSIVCLAAAVSAQQAPAPRRDGPKPFILTRDTPDVGAGDAARARARKGDCAAALDAFDMAIKTSIDPELRRDRGLCHEQLQHPFPAIDDYRAYLRDRPSAPDSEQIRDRLTRLEEQAGVGGRGEKPASGGDGGVKASGSASASISINGDGVSGSTQGSGSSGGPSRSQDDFERDEALARAASGSPLRESSGWILGPYLGVRNSSDITATFPGNQTGKVKMGVNEAVGAALRYSFGKTSTFLAELGYVAFNDQKIGGPGFFLGYEARFALSQYTTDALILGAGVGYERYRLTGSGAIMNDLMPRARLGYRHVFGPAVALELMGDGGVGFYFYKDAPNGETLSAAPVFGGYLALLVGF